MKYSEQSKEYSIKYAKEKLKRVPLDLTKEKYSELQIAAEITGESVNGFIKRLIDTELLKLHDQIYSARSSGNSGDASGN